MLISDWSSDVCSSDLPTVADPLFSFYDIFDPFKEPGIIFGDGVNFLYRKTFAKGLRGNEQAIRRWAGKFGKDVIPGSAEQVFDSVNRSEERRVGKECDSKCKTGRTAEKKKKK